jgi:hypothetical protein
MVSQAEHDRIAGLAERFETREEPCHLVVYKPQHPEIIRAGAAPPERIPEISAFFEAP